MSDVDQGEIENTVKFREVMRAAPGIGETLQNRMLTRHMKLNHRAAAIRTADTYEKFIFF